MLLDACISEAKKENMLGVAVVTRKGSFMASKELFLKKNFFPVDTAKPDFELLALRFSEKSPLPSFRINSLEAYAKGLTIIRSAQCPYSVKNVDAMMKTAEKMGLEPSLVELEDSESAQQSPSAFGTFCVIHNGEIISHHPISNTRFGTIMKGRG
jgi:hypothetical protein